jgi:putative tryptophan/tyrosine transport system substrate-binding protein
MRRREFIKVVAGPAVVWSFAARAQPAGMKRVAILMRFAESDLQWQERVSAFQSALHRLGWTEGRNVVITSRWAATDPDPSALARELIAQSPDVILACPHTATVAVHRQTTTIPIVAVISGDPVSAGFVQSYARPGGNVTAFLLFEASINTKYMQLLKDIAPQLTRVAVLHGNNTAWRGDFAAIKQVAPSFEVEPIEISVRKASDIEQAISDFAQAPNGGLILPPDSTTVDQSKLIIALAARHRLPAVYATREWVIDGGLMCYTTDVTDIFRRAASYVDRVLRGERPADLPVQAPTKYETVINAKTAKALGLTVSPQLLARADEVIE